MVGILDLLANGDIPTPLLGQVESLARGQVQAGLDGMKSYAEAINCVVKGCVVDPPVADEPDETHLGICEIPFEDRMEIFAWANAGSVPAEPFREEPKGDVAGALDLPSVPPETEPGDGGE